MEAVNLVAQLMAIAATTAPKTKGQNYVQVKVLEGEDLKKLGEAMFAYGKKTGKINFDRDGKNVLNSEAVVLIGITDTDTCGLDCGACGYPDCPSFLAHEEIEVEFRGPHCAYRILDMGIAIGSAAKTAGLMNVDNRVMYRIGVLARELKIVDWDFVMAIPLSVSGKSIYYDR